MRRGVLCGVLLLVLAFPAVAAANGWIPIPTSYGPTIRQTIMEPTVKASKGKVQITKCAFQQKHRFFVCVFGTKAKPVKAAVDVERTKSCDYKIFLVDLTDVKHPVVKHTTSFHHCY